MLSVLSTGHRRKWHHAGVPIWLRWGKHFQACVFLPLSARSLTRELVSSPENPELQRRVRCGAEDSHARQDRAYCSGSQKRHHGPGLSGKPPPPPMAVEPADALRWVSLFLCLCSRLWWWNWGWTAWHPATLPCLKSSTTRLVCITLLFFQCFLILQHPTLTGVLNVSVMNVQS